MKNQSKKHPRESMECNFGKFFWKMQEIIAGQCLAARQRALWDVWANQRQCDRAMILCLIPMPVLRCFAGLIAYDEGHEGIIVFDVPVVAILHQYYVSNLSDLRRSGAGGQPA